MTIKPYIMFNRECRAAFALYEEAFGGEMLAMQTYGEMPPNPQFPVADSDKNLVLHAQLKLTDTGIIMGSDSNRAVQTSGKVAISVELESEERAQHAWDALKDGGSVQMNLQRTFFAKLHGSVKDRYGINWMFTVT